MALQQINGNIWLGSFNGLSAVRQLKENGVTHVLSVLDVQAMGYSEEKFRENVASKGFKHLYLDMQDVEEENILKFFPEAVGFMESAIGEGGKVYVHCIAGISRSSTIVCAYLMKTNKWTADEAIDYVRSRRPVANPNEGFREQLEVWYQCGYRFDENLKPYRQWHLKQQANELDYQHVRSLPTKYTKIEMPPMVVCWRHILIMLVPKEVGAKVVGVLVNNSKHALTEPLKSSLGTDTDWNVALITSTGQHIDIPRERLGHVLGQVQTRLVTLRCRACSGILATSASFVEHPVSVTGRACQHYFVEPIEWMRPELEKGELEGRLDCPHCHGKLGSYLWQGDRCSCGTWVTPAIRIQKSRVDPMITKQRLESL